MGSRANWLWIPAVAAAVIVLALVLRSPEEPVKPPAPAGSDPPPAPALPAAAIPAAPVETDPVLHAWRFAILQRQQSGVEQSAGEFRAREEEYRERLVRLAQSDPDPRVRAFTVTLLAGFSRPPAEEFFIRALGDSGEHPRTSAILALEKVGTKSCLEALDRAAASDPVAGLRESAASAARAVRAK